MVAGSLSVIWVRDMGALRRGPILAVAFTLRIRHTVTHIVGTSQHALQAKLQISTCRAGSGEEGVEGHETAGAEGAGRAPQGQRAGRGAPVRRLGPGLTAVAVMAMKSRALTSFVMFDVLYENGTRSSNRKVSASVLAGLDGDEPARGIVEAQDRDIATASGRARSAVKSIVRSPVRVADEDTRSDCKASGRKR